LQKAYRQTTPTRERVSINGLWRWQPAAEASDRVPEGNWGYFKVPGCWPGVSDYLQQDCQTVFAHPSWKQTRLGEIGAAWYEREITVPADWAGRRITIAAEYVNSYTAVYLDGKKAGEIRFPAGELDVTSFCRPGAKHTLAMYVAALPLKAIMMSFGDTATPKQARGVVQRRGLCGDVYLTSAPPAARIAAVKVDTSFRREEITLTATLENLDPAGRYALSAEITDQGRKVARFTGKPFQAGDLKEGRVALTEKWKPEKLWDIHTPENQYQATLSLVDAGGKALDVSHPQTFGFREFWIDGKDFYLNGTRIFLSALPLDNAQIGAAWAGYEGTRESLRRLKSIGINFVYTHNYGCEPGTHLGFTEVLKACDDVGMLVSFSQPHFGQYDWQAADADQQNGYARHAAFYVEAAGNHPSVVMYSMSHNATGYAEDMNPDMIDGLPESGPKESWALNNLRRALRAEAIVHRMDPARIVYHHSSGNLSSMHTVNFYTNMAPLQELDDWCEHWATKGVKPFFTCEYMVPCTWDWTMYRGWYKGGREFGSATVPWEFCIAEWSSQFLGDAAYRVSEEEKRNVRWEANQFRAGKLWHRWDYPVQVGSRVFESQHAIIGQYLSSNWRAFRTWGVSAISPWEHDFFWSLKPGVDKSPKQLAVAWDRLQRPGFSADYIDRRYERMDLAFEQSDWAPTADGQAILRNNQPLLAYIAGKPAAFTSKDHNFTPGQTVDKQLIVINNSRQTVACECQWSLGLPRPVSGEKKVTVATGQQERVPLAMELPADVPPGSYDLAATFHFATGEVQKDSFTIHVLPRTAAPPKADRIALFDPKGETAKLLAAMNVPCQTIDAKADLSGFDVLILGKAALTVDGPGPDLGRVRDGLKVIAFEQTPQVLEQRLGFRIAEYGLRQVFKRLPDHPILAGLDTEHLRDWRGEATLQPGRLTYELSSRLSGAPAVKWCGIEVSRVWRCGNRGNTASVLIEKPARGDFLPILDGGYSLQYSPLLEYREGKGMVLFCQMDVTGRTEEDPAAARLARNLLAYVLDAKVRSAPTRSAIYAGDEAGRRHLEFSGISVQAYQPGKLSPDQVLIVGGGGKVLAGNAAAVGDFLRAGGHVLALGLDQDEANSFLPTKIGMKKAEHLASYFDPPPAASLLAGIAPADVHNRDPKQIPLVASGATILGDGVLAESGNVVFCQFPPYTLTRSQGVVPSFAIDDKDAAEGKQSAILTLGMTAGSGIQFGQKANLQPQVGKTYTIAVFLKAVDGPTEARLEAERAGSPWDRVVKGPDVAIPQDRWLDLHVTFKCETPFPQGWQAYVASTQDGGRLRADLFRLYEGEYVPPRPGQEGPRNLFANPSFESGDKPWFYSFQEQLNIRRTYRRSSFMLNRILANLGVRGSTPLLSRFAKPVGGDQAAPAASVVRNGDFSRASAGTMPDQWELSADPGKATGTREPAGPDGKPAVRLTSTAADGKTSAMLAQQDVPVKQGQWYRITLRAKAEGWAGKEVSLSLQSTQTWSSLIGYQTFSPGKEWKTFQFVVQSDGTAESKTRFQIWHANGGTLWLTDVAMVPVAPPTNEGRWLQGLYLDQPEEWDDPYRFFRW
ncbi:MAG: carbohydrate binding domain-containing protein, partial [Pirellulales bacterium]